MKQTQQPIKVCDTFLAHHTNTDIYKNLCLRVTEPWQFMASSSREDGTYILHTYPDGPVAECIALTEGPTRKAITRTTLPKGTEFDGWIIKPPLSEQIPSDKKRFLEYNDSSRSQWIFSRQGAGKPPVVHRYNGTFAFSP
jgi:hypothetical protein